MELAFLRGGLKATTSGAILAVVIMKWRAESLPSTPLAITSKKPAIALISSNLAIHQTKGEGDSWKGGHTGWFGRCSGVSRPACGIFAIG